MPSQVKFKRTLFGIKKKQVLGYIDEVSKSIEDKLLKKDSEIAKLRKDIEKLEEEKNNLQKTVDDFYEEKEKISAVFLKAEETARETVAKGKADAEKILAATKEKSEEILRNTEYEKQKIIHETEAVVNEKRAKIVACKNEINYLRENIKLSLNKFDEILGGLSK